MNPLTSNTNKPEKGSGWPKISEGRWLIKMLRADISFLFETCFSWERHDLDTAK